MGVEGPGGGRAAAAGELEGPAGGRLAAAGDELAMALAWRTKGVTATEGTPSGHTADSTGDTNRCLPRVCTECGPFLVLTPIRPGCSFAAQQGDGAKANGMHFVPELLVKRGAPLAIVWRAAHGQLKGVSKRDRERVRLFGSPAHPNPVATCSTAMQRPCGRPRA